MEERRSPRLVMQRRLELEPIRPSTAPTSVPAPEAPTRPPAIARSASAPLAPSNGALVERQLRWYRERAKFETHRPGDEGSK